MRCIEDGKSYQSHDVMDFFGFTNEEAFKNWVRDNNVRNAQIGNSWVFPGTAINCYIEKASRTMDDKRNAKRKAD